MDDITLKNYYEMFTATWKLFREFKNLHTDEDRERIKNAATMIYHKYPCQLMLDLIWAVFNELDRRDGVGKWRRTNKRSGWQRIHKN